MIKGGENEKEVTVDKRKKYRETRPVGQEATLEKRTVIICYDLLSKKIKRENFSIIVETRPVIILFLRIDN